MQRLKDYHWQGNVRQLQNFLERLVLIVDNDFETAVFAELFEALFEYQACPVQSKRKTTRGSPIFDPETANQTVRETIQKTLELTGYHKTKTAENLGISRTTLWKKMKKYSL